MHAFFLPKRARQKTPKQTKNRQEFCLICSWQIKKKKKFTKLKFQYFLREIHLDFLGGMEIENVNTPPPPFWW